MYYLAELSEIVKVAFDLIEGEIEEHASDLRCSCFADYYLDVLEDELADKIPVVGLGVDGFEVIETL